MVLVKVPSSPCCPFKVSIDASVTESLSEGGGSGDHAPVVSMAEEVVENFVRLEKSVLSGAQLTVKRATFSAVEAKSLALLRAHLAQRGLRYLRVDLETQVKDANFSTVLFKGRPNFLV